MPPFSVLAQWPWECPWTIWGLGGLLCDRGILILFLNGDLEQTTSMVASCFPTEGSVTHLGYGEGRGLIYLEESGILMKPSRKA